MKVKISISLDEQLLQDIETLRAANLRTLSNQIAVLLTMQLLAMADKKGGVK